MWTFETPRTSADSSATAKSPRKTVRRIAAALSTMVVLSVVSTSSGQQGPSGFQPLDRSTAPASSLGDALGHRLQQFRNVGTQTSDSEAIEEAIEEAAVVPTLFLDLTQDKQSLQAGPSSERSVEGNLEITAGSNPTQVLMRAVAWIVIALCIFSLTILGLRHWQRQRGLLPTTNSRSRVVETLSLGPGRTVSLIELAGFRALVASDAGGIRSLVLAPLSFPDELMEAGQASDPQVSKMIVK